MCLQLWWFRHAADICASICAKQTNGAQSGKSLGCPLPWQPALLQWGCCHGDLKSTLASVALHCVALIDTRGGESVQLTSEKGERKAKTDILCPANSVDFYLIHSMMPCEHWRICVWITCLLNLHCFAFQMWVCYKWYAYTFWCSVHLAWAFGGEHFCWVVKQCYVEINQCSSQKQAPNFALFELQTVSRSLKLCKNVHTVNVTWVFDWVGNKASD